MGNLMVGDFYPPFLGDVDKIYCGSEQCWPVSEACIWFAVSDGQSAAFDVPLTLARANQGGSATTGLDEWCKYTWTSVPGGFHITFDFSPWLYITCMNPYSFSAVYFDSFTSGVWAVDSRTVFVPLSAFGWGTSSCFEVDASYILPKSIKDDYEVYVKYPIYIQAGQGSSEYLLKDEESISSEWFIHTRKSEYNSFQDSFGRAKHHGECKRDRFTTERTDLFIASKYIPGDHSVYKFKEIVRDSQEDEITFSDPTTATTDVLIPWHVYLKATSVKAYQAGSFAWYYDWEASSAFEYIAAHNPSTHMELTLNAFQDMQTYKTFSISFAELNASRHVEKEFQNGHTTWHVTIDRDDDDSMHITARPYIGASMIAEELFEVTDKPSVYIHAASQEVFVEHQFSITSIYPNYPFTVRLFNPNPYDDYQLGEFLWETTFGYRSDTYRRSDGVRIFYSDPPTYTSTGFEDGHDEYNIWASHTVSLVWYRTPDDGYPEENTITPLWLSGGHFSEAYDPIYGGLIPRELFARFWSIDWSQEVPIANYVFNGFCPNHPGETSFPEGKGRVLRHTWIYLEDTTDSSLTTDRPYKPVFYVFETTKGEAGCRFAWKQWVFTWHFTSGTDGYLEVEKGDGAKGTCTIDGRHVTLK